MKIVDVELRNRRAYLTSDYPETLKESFSFRPKNYFFHPKFRSGAWTGDIQCLKGGALPAGLFISLREIAEEDHGIQFRVTDVRKRPLFHPFPKSYSLRGFDIRPFQRTCVRRMVKASATGGLVLNATGTGKTFIAGLYLRVLNGTGVFVVDELTLMEQAREELAKVIGEEIGVIGDQTFDPRRISVATIQTLHRHCETKAFRRWHRGLDVMILDEIHVLLNRRSIETIREMRPKACFGLTATLELEKEYVWFPAASLCGPRIFEYSYERAKDEKYLLPGVVVGVDILKHIPPTQGPLGYLLDYESHVVKSAFLNKTAAALAALCVQRGHQVAILAERLDHLTFLSKRLAGVPHEVINGKRPKLERLRIKKLFDAGKTKLLIVNRVFKKGINLKRLDCILDVANMRNPNDARQKFGRGVRLCEQKEGLLYFDFGFRKPENLEGLEEEAKNRFESSTRSRRRALKKQGVPVYPILAREGATKILDKAERCLQRLLKGFQQSVKPSGK